MTSGNIPRARKGSAAPTFGRADPPSCGGDQRHLPGFIQSHGALLVLREPDYVIVQASANAAELLDLPGNPLGEDIRSLAGNLAERIGPHLCVPMLPTIPLALRCRVGLSRRLFDVVLHRPPQGALVVELEPARRPIDRTRQVEDAIGRVLAAYTLQALCDDTARIFRDLTGYDRVMVYRFDRQGHGEVLSEERLRGLEPLLGSRCSASEIPQAARRMYESNRVRPLVDVASAPVPVLPGRSPLTGQKLDMSMCALRSASPIHIRHLKNIGVGATLVVSLMVAGQLWGLVSCHHHAPRGLPFETRVLCDLLAEAVATRVAALESATRGQVDLAVRRLEQGLAKAISRKGDWRTALFDSAQSILQPLNATGAALLFDGQVTGTGDIPETWHIRQIGKWLDHKAPDQVIATASLALDVPEFDPLKETASGLVATRLSRNPGEHLLWFRPERVRTEIWSGDPTNTGTLEHSPISSSPPCSSERRHQVVARTSDPWTETDLIAAKLIGDTVQDVILQFQSVSILIAQEQLARVQRQVRGSEVPVVIADADENIVTIDDAFMTLLGPVVAPPTRLLDLPECFKDVVGFRRRLRDLCERGLTWRGEVCTDRDNTPLLVRADPVYSLPGKVSGFILVFTNLTAQRAAEAARSSFDKHIFERTQGTNGRSELNIDPMMRSLLSSVVQNAQLAALEITDGPDMARMPEMLDSVRRSVARTKRALEHLAMHANSGSARE